MYEVDHAEIKLTIAGQVLQTGPGQAWELAHLADDAFLTPSTSIAQYANRAGGFFKKRKYGPRPVVCYIEAADKRKSSVNAGWNFLKSFIDATVDAELEVTRYGHTRSLFGSITEIRRRDEDEMHWNESADIRFEFTAPYPYYRAAAREISFADEVPLMSFPLTFWYDGGMTAGLLTDEGNSITFTVDGQDAPDSVIRLTAAGPVVNPYVSTAQGDFVQAMCTMAAGDVLEIEWSEKARMRLNGAWCSRSLTSYLFPFRIGVNTLTIGAESGLANLAKKLILKENYQ